MTDDRRKILARRELFMRSVLLGATAGTLLSGCDPSGPVCHSARRNLPRGAVNAVGCAIPLPCLSVVRVPPPGDAGADVEDAGG
jgi:hypothetical protein